MPIFPCKERPNPFQHLHWIKPEPIILDSATKFKTDHHLKNDDVVNQLTNVEDDELMKILERFEVI